ELGRTLFLRSQREDERQERNQFLERAVEQYEQALQIDPEDLDSHYGLAQCYTLLGAGFSTPVDPTSAGRSAAELGKTLARYPEEPAVMLQAASALQVQLLQLRDEPSRPDRPKLPLLQSLIADCRRFYQNAAQVPEFRTAAANLL